MWDNLIRSINKAARILGIDLTETERSGKHRPVFWAICSTPCRAAGCECSAPQLGREGYAKTASDPLRRHGPGRHAWSASATRWNAL